MLAGASRTTTTSNKARLRMSFGSKHLLGGVNSLFPAGVQGCEVAGKCTRGRKSGDAIERQRRRAIKLAAVGRLG